MSFPRVLFWIVLWLLNGSSLHAQGLGEKRVFDNGEGQTMPYRLLGPNDPDEGVDYPLIVFLHGSGERGTGNTIQMQAHIEGLRNATQTDEFASYLIAPQLPSGGTFWSPNQPYDLTMEIIESLELELPVDSNRIYITGLSLGGFGTMNYLEAFPNRFAAAVPMSGAGNAFAADTFHDVPTWFFHGTSDTVVGIDSTRATFNAMEQAGGAPLSSEIPNGEHGIWAPVYADWRTEEYGLYPWMFGRRNSDAPAEAIIPLESEWRYLDDGSDQMTQWRLSDYDDSSWKTGLGQFGYNDGDEATILQCDADGGTRCRLGSFATTYFRTTFDIDDTDAIASLEGQVIRDAAVAIYINGEEIFRDSNLSATAAFDEYAGTPVADNLSAGFTIDPRYLTSGENQLAVELHKRDRANDLSFDMRLAVRTIPEPTSKLFASFLVLSLMVNRQKRTGECRLTSIASC